MVRTAEGDDGMIFGMQVKVVFADGKQTTYHNVTETHWNYNYSMGGAIRMVAFESDIHGTGYTWPCSHIAEFEVTPDTKIHDNM